MIYINICIIICTHTHTHTHTHIYIYIYIYIYLPSRLGLQKTPLTSVLDMTVNNMMVRFQKCWSLGNAEYPFIAITPMSTLARNGST